MLYQLHEMQQALFAPLRLSAEALHLTLTNPLMPAGYTRIGRAMAAGASVFERVVRPRGKPDWGLSDTSIDGRTVPVAIETVAATPFCNLLRFRRQAELNDPKILLVAPISGHHATLLRGTVAALMPDHDVHVTDWIDARNVPLSRGAFSFDDCIATLRDQLALLGPGCHVVAVCQPAVPVLAAVALMNAEDHPATPLTMTLMGGPINPAAAPTVPTRLADDHSLDWFERSVIGTVPMRYPGRLRRVYPGFMQLTGFMSMNLDRHLDAHVKLFEHLIEGDGEGAAAHRAFYDEYLSVMDLTAEFYLETIERVFQKKQLANGQMRWRGERVDPAAITRTALFTVEGELDDICAPGQTIAAHDLCSGLAADRHFQHLQPRVGHYGIFNGRRWREQIAPRVRGFIRRFDPDRRAVALTAMAPWDGQAAKLADAA